MLMLVLGFTKFLTINAYSLVTLYCEIKSDLDVQQTGLTGRFVEQKIVLSSSLRSDQILDNQSCEPGNTLLSCLNLT